MKHSLTLFATLMLGALASAQGQPKVGYTDTPKLPGQPWRVHDAERPQPRVVTPGAQVGAAPSDATVLFDGTDLSRWERGNGKPAHWKVENGYMEVAKGGSIRTKQAFGDCQLHIEFATPAEVKGNSQGRGNSGVFLMGRYEVQVLDSYQNPTYPDGQAGSLYGQWPPLVNASRGPGQWQTYDIVFEAPRFEGKKLVKPAHVTLMHNGVIVHNRKPMIGASTHRRVGTYSPHAATGKISLQDHGNPMRFRNIWIRKLGHYDEVAGESKTKTGWTGVLDEASFKALHELNRDKAPALHGKMLELSDGSRAYYSPSANQKPGPAIVLIHEWWGLNDHIKHWADRLAAAGYSAIAVDLYQGTVATTREDALNAMKAVQQDAAMTTLKAAHDFLEQSAHATKTASMGWCFGGGWSLKLAMANPDLDAAVIYYGRLVTDTEQLGSIRAPILGVFGNLDRGIPPRAVDAFADAMKAAGKPLQLARYDANHAFANPSSARYDQTNAEKAWQRVQKFLASNLRGESR